MKLAFPSKEALLTETGARANEFEQQFHGCGQCVLAALMETFPPIRNPEAFQAASGLGGGVGLSMEGSCGALIGGTLAMGLFFGRQLDSMADPEGRRFNSYRMARRLQHRFEEVYGSGICKHVQEKMMGRFYRLYIPEEFSEFVENGGHKTHCPQVVERSARWSAEIILEELEAAGVELQFSSPKK